MSNPKLESLKPDEYGIVHASTVYPDEGPVYRIALQGGEARNNKAASDAMWAGIEERMKPYGPAKDRNWWVTGIGYTTILFFVQLDGVFDPKYEEKCAFLYGKVLEILNLKLVDCQ